MRQSSLLLSQFFDCDRKKHVQTSENSVGQRMVQGYEPRQKGRKDIQRKNGLFAFIRKALSQILLSQPMQKHPVSLLPPLVVRQPKELVWRMLPFVLKTERENDGIGLKVLEEYTNCWDCAAHADLIGLFGVNLPKNRACDTHTRLRCRN